MNNLFRGLIAGYGAKKLGGGCFGTVLVFILIWVALGECSSSPKQNNIDTKAASVEITLCKGTVNYPELTALVAQ